ncbi:MAG: hypothetical protein A2138_08040 [Deltaproteobacteria bacterium RBG_16_71_12]|nr:MAG: hypothetical protein A2138_08040 [Deltaproteobacteria bacterium RBG_16_71_12]
MSHAQATCDPTTFEPSCNTDGSIAYCDDQTNPSAPVEASITCTEAYGAGSCAVPGCDGACTTITMGCVAAVGEACVGFGPLVDGDSANDDLAGSVQCAGDATCSVQSDATDLCEAHIGPACTAGGEAASCTGTVLTICLTDQADTLALTSNIALDCSLLSGSSCGQQPCDCDAHCGTGSTCNGGFCDFGVTCTYDPDPAECEGGEGEGEGEEGEGEGEDGECASDRDCDEGEVCEDGECTGGSEPAPVCNHAATSAGVPAAGLLALGGLLMGLRRRRRA